MCRVEFRGYKATSVSIYYVYLCICTEFTNCSRHGCNSYPLPDKRAIMCRFAAYIYIIVFENNSVHNYPFGRISMNS